MQRYNSFNGLRGFAAIGILLMHYLANMDANIVLPLKQSNPLLYGSIIPFFTTFVYMFFIISAFSMCCGYFKKFTMKSTTSGEVSEFNTDKFYLKRYSRIWPFFALLVGIDVVLKPSVSEIYQAFADLTLAFNLLPNPDISVIGVGWFLGLIFLFYMIFPWFVFLLQSKKRAWFALIISVAFHFILIRYFLTSEFCTESQIANFRHNMIYSFPFFMIGGILYLYKDKLQLTKNLSKTILLVITLIATSLCFTEWKPKFFSGSDLWTAIIFTLWIIYAISGEISFKGFKILDNRITKLLSDYSMEIYLCHMVIFRAIEKIHLEKYIQNDHALYWTWSFLGIGLSFLFSWFVINVLFKNIKKLTFTKKINKD